MNKKSAKKILGFAAVVVDFVEFDDVVVIVVFIVVVVV